MDRMPDKPSFNRSEMDAQYAGVRGDASETRGRGVSPVDGRRGRNIGIGLATGLVIGVVLGLVFGNLVVGIVIGAVLGIAIGAVMDR